ncbi:putative Na+/H+ antiporter [Pseudomonas sp.]|uniref:putative Na+/H+ antiporter n=1 Tax=Pseudomonas sp. TaxID=306 RepID=UPI00345834B6
MVATLAINNFCCHRKNKYSIGVKAPTKRVIQTHSCFPDHRCIQPVQVHAGCRRLGCGWVSVIANAPNPAGVALLKHGLADEAIGAGGLLLGALGPTVVATAAFMFFNHSDETKIFKNMLLGSLKSSHIRRQKLKISFVLPAKQCRVYEQCDRSKFFSCSHFRSLSPSRDLWS